MENYRAEDYVFLKGTVARIKSIGEMRVYIDGEMYNLEDIIPIPLEEAGDNLVLLDTIPMGSLISDGKNTIPKPEIKVNFKFITDFKIDLNKNKECSDRSGRYWMLRDIPSNTLNEYCIKYVHELQHYLRDTGSSLYIGIIKNSF
jgi:hypothetical protein